MRIAFINGSPKAKDSASEYILQEIKPILEQKGAVISDFHFQKPQLKAEDIKDLKDFDALIFAFPLYVDGIPSHLVSCLLELENYFNTAKDKEIKVYSLINCGFYEGHQNRLAMSMMENWCIKAGLKWGQGIGIGAGGMIPSLKNVPMGHGPKKNFGNAVNELVESIIKGSSAESLYINANFPRFLYKIAGEASWRQGAKENGLKTKDLFRRK